MSSSSYGDMYMHFLVFQAYTRLSVLIQFSEHGPTHHHTTTAITLRTYIPPSSGSGWMKIYTPHHNQPFAFLTNHCSKKSWLLNSHFSRYRQTCQRNVHNKERERVSLTFWRKDLHCLSRLLFIPIQHFTPTRHSTISTCIEKDGSFSSIRNTA